MSGSSSRTTRIGKVPASRRAENCSADPNGGDERLRESGIQVVGGTPWGSHICVFYETKDDVLETAAAYFAAGVKSNEFCVWAISDPVTEEDAKTALRRAIPGLYRDRGVGQIEIIQGKEWYLKGGQFDLKRIISGWTEKLQGALAKGYEGVRISGDAFLIETNHWKVFCEYEEELDRSLAGQKMIVLCTYSLEKSRAVDVLNVARAHQCSIARRNGEWDFLETPELRQAKKEIQKLRGALDVLSKPFPGHASLTPRERVAMAQIVRGASSKEAARALGVSPRTVEFHRANVMRKLGAKNTADLVRKVVGE